MKIRLVKTGSRNTAVQVVSYRKYKTTILKHIGSAKNKKGLDILLAAGRDWLENHLGQQRLFPPTEPGLTANIITGQYKYQGFRYGLLNETINRVFKALGLIDQTDDKPISKSWRMLLDLALIRTVKPASKRESQKLLGTLFGINYGLTDIYRALPDLNKWQDRVESKLIAFAKQELGFDFNFVLYDITTLYFETFTEDDFRKRGYSKDNKIGQPQILVGLVVSPAGFPLSFAVFEGSKFEGHTLIPVISDFKVKHNITALTVVADAGMLNKDNIAALVKAGLSYIVGARLGSVSLKTAQEISRRLNGVDAATIRIQMTEGLLVCGFSAKRYAKDKKELEKQVAKAKLVLTGKRLIKRSKYLAKTGEVTYHLNQGLIDKTELLLGIKGYRTNVALPDTLVIARYHDLWQVEKAFRISKNDLAVRPIYHVKKEAVTAHVLICVISLAVLKFMEIKTGKSAKYVLEGLKSVTDGLMLNTLTDRVESFRSDLTDDVDKLLKEMGFPH